MTLKPLVFSVALLTAFGVQAADSASFTASPAPSPEARQAQREALRKDVREIAEARYDREEARRLGQEAAKRGDAVAAGAARQREVEAAIRLREERRDLRESRSGHPRQQPGANKAEPTPLPSLKNQFKHQPSMAPAVVAPSQSAGFPAPPKY